MCSCGGNLNSFPYAEANARAGFSSWKVNWANGFRPLPQISTDHGSRLWFVLPAGVLRGWMRDSPKDTHFDRSDGDGS